MKNPARLGAFGLILAGMFFSPTNGGAMSLFRSEMSQEETLTAWRDAAPVGPGKSRVEMVDVAQAAVPLGTTKAEVEQLLGKPYTRKVSQWLYVVKIDSFGRDYDYLHIRFDESGQVAAAEQITEKEYQGQSN